MDTERQRGPLADGRTRTVYVLSFPTPLTDCPLLIYTT
jgi:hypothetical protein